MACDSQEGNLFHEFGELLLLPLFLWCYQKRTWRFVFHFSWATATKVHRWKKGGIQERKREPKHPLFIPSPNKKENLIEEKLKSLLWGWKDANSSVFIHTLLLGGQHDALEQTTEPTAHPADLGSNAGSTVALVCAAFNSSRQQLLIKLDECLSLCFSILEFR